MSVRIRLKRMGKKHRPFFRVCAMDKRAPRDGRVLEEVGTYDPMVPDVDARAILKADRIAYWLGVGAQPSDNVKTLIKKYGLNGTHLEAQKNALSRLTAPRAIPDPGEPTYVPKPKEKPAASTEAPPKPVEEKISEPSPEPEAADISGGQPSKEAAAEEASTEETTEQS